MLDIDFSHSDEQLRQILEEARVVAVVGESSDHYYTSYQVAHYLKSMGYKVYPVNPTISHVDGDKAYPSLAAVPEPIDVVDVFRNGEYLGEVAEAAIAARAKVLWAQLDVVSPDGRAERKALEAGLKVVSDHCMRTEHERLKIAPKDNAR
jgi:predicted CoA-binding protein